MKKTRLMCPVDYWLFASFFKPSVVSNTAIRVQSRMKAAYPPSAKLETSEVGRGSVGCPVCSGDTYRVSGSRLSIQGLKILLLLTDKNTKTHNTPEQDTQNNYKHITNIYTFTNTLQMNHKYI